MYERGEGKGGVNTGLNLPAILFDEQISDTLRPRLAIADVFCKAITPNIITGWQGKINWKLRQRYLETGRRQNQRDMTISGCMFHPRIDFFSVSKRSRLRRIQSHYLGAFPPLVPPLPRKPLPLLLPSLPPRVLPYFAGMLLAGDCFCIFITSGRLMETWGTRPFFDLLRRFGYKWNLLCNVAICQNADYRIADAP